MVRIRTNPARLASTTGAALVLLLATHCGGRTTELEGRERASSGGNGIDAGAPTGGRISAGGAPGDGDLFVGDDLNSGGGPGGKATGGGSSSSAGGSAELGGEGNALGDDLLCEDVGCSELEECIEGVCRANAEVRAQTAMVEILGGTFQMGKELYPVTSPVHERTVETFFIDRTEVTVRAYNQCLESGACSRPTFQWGGGEAFYRGDLPDNDDYPINFISPQNAENFCAWMGKRLPSETEWEYAAGGNLGYDFPWGEGEALCCHHACTIPQGIEADSNGCAVAQFPAMANGLYDMSASHVELTRGMLCNYSDNTEDGYLPGCDTEGYILRGSSSGSIALEPIQYRELLESEGLAESFEHPTVGFRCARSP